MSITFSGLGSGLPVNDWVTALVGIKQKEINAISNEKSILTSSNSALSSVKGTYSDLLSSLQAITDAQFGSTDNVFTQKKVTTSDAATVSASVSALASKQNVSVFVSQLATKTQAQSSATANVAGKIDRDTTFASLANGQAKAGSMSVYVNNEKFTVTIDSADTVGGVLDKITSATGLWAGVIDGKITLADAEPLEGVTPSSTKNVVVGSAYDTSNFTSISYLKKNANGAYQSNQSIFKANTAALLTSPGAGFSSLIKEGTFKIGDALFTIGTGTTMQSLLSEINASDKAGVNARWDSTKGKMVLDSKAEGSFNINIENISGNFTDVMGLTTSTYDVDNTTVLTSKLADTSQTVGDVAIFKINGSDVISQSNTVTSDVSGIAGLTLTLNAKSTGSTNTTLAVSADNSTLKGKLDAFIFRFNTVMSNTAEVTGKNGYLHGESSLNMIKNNLRQSVTASVAGDTGYTSLSSIGITTGAIGAGLNEDTDKIQIDSAVLAKALEENPDAVKKLLVGDGVSDGVFSKLSKQVTGALAPTNGFFAARTKTFDSQIADLTKTISTRDDELIDYKKTLENKFNLMDQLISSMKSQFSNISALVSPKK